jgi:hypothetical protein
LIMCGLCIATAPQEELYDPTLVGDHMTLRLPF